MSLANTYQIIDKVTAVKIIILIGIVLAWILYLTDILELSCWGVLILSIISGIGLLFLLRFKVQGAVKMPSWMRSEGSLLLDKGRKEIRVRKVFYKKEVFHLSLGQRRSGFVGTSSYS